MSFSALLAQIKSGGTAKPSTGLNPRPNTPKKLAPPKKQPVVKKQDAVKRSIVPKFDVTADPAVARLKAARAAEREKEEERKREAKRQQLIAKGIDPDKVKAKTSRLKKTTTQPKKQNVAARVSRLSKTATPPSPPPAPVKKLNFLELMKEAEQFDGKNLSVDFNKKNKEKELSIAELRRMKKKKKAESTVTPKERSAVKRTEVKASQMPPPKPALARLAGPSEEVRRKLEKRKKLKEKKSKYGRDFEEYDDYDDDFVVDDEEEEQLGDDPGYNRDEIWAMFNKGRKRHYDFSDDESDMEATGADVFEEEERSRRQALLDEKREKELEKKLLRRKQERLKRRR